jgi:hypothetical protein
MSKRDFTDAMQILAQLKSLQQVTTAPLQVHDSEHAAVAIDLGSIIAERKV